MSNADQGPPYGDDPATWPEYRRRMMAELDAAGIPEHTIFALVNSDLDFPQAVPIMVDWLEHLDERVPAGEPREAWRWALLRNLITKHARGNQRAFDVVLDQFYADPPLATGERESAILALLAIATPAQFDQMAALIAHLTGVEARWHVVSWLSTVKTPAAVALATGLLTDPDPAVRYQAVRALIRQRARGVRSTVAALLDDVEPDVRREAEKALAKLPE